MMNEDRSSKQTFLPLGVSIRHFLKPPALFWRELRQFVDAQLLFELGNLIYNFEEALFAEQFVFLLFEVVAQRLIFVRRNNLAESGKKNRVFSSLVRTIHAQKGAQGVSQLLAVRRHIFKRSCRGQFSDFGG